jgi:hypothetical protein
LARRIRLAGGDFAAIKQSMRRARRNHSPGHFQIAKTDVLLPCSNRHAPLNHGFSKDSAPLRGF